MLRRRGLSVSPRFLWECLTSRTVSPFPAPATIARSVRLSRTTRSCTLPAKGYVTYRAGASFGESTRYRTRSSVNSPTVAYIHRLLHRFQPKPWRKKRQYFSAFALTLYPSSQLLQSDG